MSSYVTNREDIARLGSFSQVPNEIWKMKLSIHARDLWGYLNSIWDNSKTTYSDIVQATGLSRSRIRKFLDELINKGMLAINKGADNSNQYIILGRPHWKFPEEVSSTCRTNSGGENEGVSSTCRTNVSSTCLTTGSSTCRTSYLYKNKNIVEKHIKTPDDDSSGKKSKAPDYEQQDLDFAKAWISWLKERGSYHSKTANKYKYAADLAKLRRDYGFSIVVLPELKKLVSESLKNDPKQFWSKNLISPSSLLKNWADGKKISYLLDALEKQRKEEIEWQQAADSLPHMSRDELMRPRTFLDEITF